MLETQPTNAVSWLVQRVDRMLSCIDAGFGRVERRIGTAGASMVVGAFLLALAAIYCAPAVKLINHGILYGAFSEDPYHETLTSPIRLRPFSPWVAYFLHLRGTAFMAFPLLAGVGFLAVIVHTARKRGLSGAECVVLAAVIALTSPVLFTLHFAGYVDLVSYLFIAIAIAGVASDVVVGACVALALLNHDSNLFVLPWLFFFAYRRRKGIWPRARLTVSLGVALLIVMLVRDAIARRAPVTWSPDFYLNYAYLRENALLNVRGAWFGLFMVFKLAWLIPFFAGLELLAKKRRTDLFELVLAVGCGLATLIITSDVSRLPSLAFPALLSSAAVLREDVLAGPRFARALGLLVLVNLLVPQYYVGQSRPIVLYPLPVALVLKASGYDPWEDWLNLKPVHFSQE